MSKGADRGTGSPDLAPAELQEGVERILRERGIDPAEADRLTEVIFTQAVAQSTIGLYPPPRMLAEYRHIDQRVYDEIVEGAASQRKHRQALERLSTERSAARQDTANATQNACSVLSILVAAGLVGYSIFVGREMHWLFPSILVAVGVGGRPVATLVAQFMLGRERSRRE